MEIVSLNIWEGWEKSISKKLELFNELLSNVEKNKSFINKYINYKKFNGFLIAYKKARKRFWKRLKKNLMNDKTKRVSENEFIFLI